MIKLQKLNNLKEREQLKNSPKTAEIVMPFIPLSVSGSQIYFIASQPQAGRSLYSLHLIQDNSLKYGKRKGIAYFVSKSKIMTIKNSGFGAMLTTNKNVNYSLIKDGKVNQIIEDIEQDFMVLEGDYLVIDGFEKLFTFSGNEVEIEEKELKYMVDKFLTGIEKISKDKNIPVFITTSLVANEFSAPEDNNTLEIEIGLNILEIKTKNHISLRNPFYYYDEEDAAQDESEFNRTHKWMEFHRVNAPFVTSTWPMTADTLDILGKKSLG